MQFTETSEVLIQLDGYDDIFSDFDVRPYSRRALSSDFIDEMKRATRYKRDEGIELTFIIPLKGRDEQHEATIRERLAGHFARHRDILIQDKRKVIFLGAGMMILGIIGMIVTTFIRQDPSTTLLHSFLIVFFEPASLFMLWEGMDQILFNSKKINPELDFYRKMSNTEGQITFRAVEPIEVK